MTLVAASGSPDVMGVTIRTIHKGHARAVPLISRFFGLSIYMYYDDHPPPHIHVRAGDRRAMMVLRTGRVQGLLAGAQRTRLDRWRRDHLMELHLNWQRASQHEPLHAIDPE